MITRFDFLYSDLSDISKHMKMLRKDAVKNVSRSHPSKEALLELRRMLVSVCDDADAILSICEDMICACDPEA